MIEVETAWLGKSLGPSSDAHRAALEEVARADANLVSARRAGAQIVDEAEARVARARDRLAEIEAEMRENTDA